MVEAYSIQRYVDASWTDTLTPFPKGPSLDLIHNLHLSDLFWVVLSFAGCTFAGWIMPNKIQIIHIIGYKLLWGQWILQSQTLAQK
jgi:hypothetical protein